MISDNQLSDLFFNTDHDLPMDAEPAEIGLAIGEAADTFAARYPQFGKPGQWYANEFFRRW